MSAASVPPDHVAPLACRDTRLDPLEQRVRALAARRDSAAVTLTGQGGSGRTTLLERAARTAREHGLTVALARCTPAEAELPYGVVSQLAAQLRHRPAGRPSLDALSRGGPDGAAVAALCAEFLDLARHDPMVLAVDDAHWADPASRRWLRALAARLRQAPLLLVRTLAAGAVPADRYPPGIEQMLPMPTPAADAASMATGSGQGDRVVRAVDGLPPDALALLRAIAVAGDEVDPALPRALAPPRVLPAPAVLELLTSLGLVAGAGRPRPSTPAVRTHVLAAMPAAERDRLARRAADLAHRMALPDEQVAGLLLAAPPAGTGWGARLLRRVACSARRRGEPGHAAALLNRALRERPGAELRRDLLTELALIEAPRAPEAAARRLRQVLTEAGPEAALAPLVRAADLLQALGEGAAARQAIADACARRAPGAAGPLAAIGLLAAGDTVTGPVLPEHQLPAITDPQPDPVRAGVLAWRLALRGGGRARAAELAGTALYPAGGDRPFGPRIHACRALLYAEEPGEAVLGLEQVLREARGQGAALPAALALLERARCELVRGNLALVAEDLAAARAQLPPESWPPRVLPDLLAMQASLHLARDEVEEAERVLAAPLPAAAAEGIGWAHLQYTLGRLRMVLADPGAALPRFLECGRALLSRNCHNPAVSAWRSQAAAAQTAAGEHAAADRLVRTAVRLARRWGAPGTHGAVHLLAAGSGCAAQEGHLRAAVPLLRASAVAQPRVVALAESALTLIAAGDRRGATLALAAASPGAVPVPTGAHGSLSAQERRIAALAAAGWSTARIAGLLSLGGRTVEQRLTGVYRKLGLRGRAQLASTFHPVAMAG
ncbi:AAA family ATPase [Amycolatopsis aidingensis]|uniref:AAA family ATPase n=1 Tax=Amycolatopsis aidingensis TaxID=2842453 RepID=UPI001C0D6266|nr:LuxR family transcriptional regulator [Amycolatopsis aidingensis]